MLLELGASVDVIASPAFLEPYLVILMVVWLNW